MTPHEAIEAIKAILAQVEAPTKSVTANFTLEEFTRGNTPTTEQLANICKLASNLQVLRDTLGAPIVITSGLRSVEQNSAAGGAPRSRHLTGEAADIRVNGVEPRELKRIIEELIDRGEMQQGGLAAYANHVHYDNRGTRARW
jgi:uncharacterized protein YcbK (DUF882 family)